MPGQQEHRAQDAAGSLEQERPHGRQSSGANLEVPADASGEGQTAGGLPEDGVHDARRCQTEEGGPGVWWGTAGPTGQLPSSLTSGQVLRKHTRAWPLAGTACVTWPRAGTACVTWPLCL